MKHMDKNNFNTKALVKIVSKWKRKNQPLTRDSRPKGQAQGSENRLHNKQGR